MQTRLRMRMQTKKRSEGAVVCVDVVGLLWHYHSSTHAKLYCVIISQPTKNPMHIDLTQARSKIEICGVNRFNVIGTSLHTRPTSTRLSPHQRIAHKTPTSYVAITRMKREKEDGKPKKRGVERALVKIAHIYLSSQSARRYFPEINALRKSLCTFCYYSTTTPRCHMCGSMYTRFPLRSVEEPVPSSQLFVFCYL